MSDEQPYTPIDEEIARTYAHGGMRRPDPARAAFFDRWLAAHDARVRRDAAREALDGLVEHIDWTASQFLGVRVGTQKAQDVRDYRDTHYPEETCR